MAFTNNNDFSVPATGQGDWDSDLSGNWQIIDRGYHAKLSAAVPINSGDIIWVASGALAWQYDAKSLDLTEPFGMAYKAVASGENADFLRQGVVSSIGTWSGFMTIGQPVYVDPGSPGFPANSYSAAAFAVGIALAADTVLVSPGTIHSEREHLHNVQSLGELVVGSAHFTTIDVGHAGIINAIELISNSVDAWSAKLFSGSAQVASEQLFSIGSTNPESFSLFQTGAVVYRNTDITSPGLLFAAITVESGSGVGSGHVNVVIHAERFR